MTRPPKPVSTQQEIYLVMAVDLLRVAMKQAQKADSPRAVAAIRSALRSTEDALTLMRHRRRRTEETEK